MEELLVCALLLSVGFDIENKLAETIDKLFENSPSNELYLELEWKSDAKERMEYIFSNIGFNDINEEKFGNILMKNLNEFFENTDIHIWADRITDIWHRLPTDIAHKEPFFKMIYADDPLSWGDEEQTIWLYREMLDHYRNIE